jgi:hypothetical protein
MAHAFDNRNFIPGKQQTFYSVVSPSSRPDITNVLWEATSPSPSPSPRITSASPQSSPKPNHPPPSYEESIFNKALANRHNSRSSLHSPSVHHYSTTSPLVSYSLPSTPNDSHQYQRQPEGYHSYVSPHRSSDTKPPPPARIPKVTNNNSHHRSNAPPQYSPSGMKTSTTYLNTTQLYITQSPSRDPPPPPPPPPRYPLQPPAIPPRSSPICHQTNSSSAPSPRPTSQMVYRSPVVTSTAKRNDIIDPQILERQFHSLAIDNNNRNREYSIGQCRKCDETITNRDDTCDILGQIYHSSCAVCVVCARSVKNKHYFVKDQLYCEEDFLVRNFSEQKIQFYYPSFF